MKKFKELIKEFNANISYVGGVRLGSHGNFKPIASLGDTPPKRVHATYMHGRAAGSLRPFLKAQKKDKLKIESWWDDLIGKLKSKTIRRGNYKLGQEILQSVIDRKKKGGKLNHNILYYAQRIGDQIPGVEYITLAKMVHEEVELDKTVLDKYLDSMTLEEMRSEEEKEFEKELV